MNAGAQESIYILDWWLSPELYLRRPPSKNEQYRLDVMLKAAAERGVKIYVIVYKEVEAALTLDSAHTKHALERLHPNISVFRHPDHLPTGYDLHSELGKAEKVSNWDLATVSKDAIKALYGAVEDVVLYWAHHEKLIVIDRRLVFMGGLDLSHPIADAHPGNLDNIIFPGQDYNNARIYDFSNVGDWNQNKLDRTKSSRMGWSDVALSLNGPIVNDLISHFVDRWNFMFDEKYAAKDPGKYVKLQDVRSEERPHDRSPDQGGGFYDRFTRGISDQMENLGLSSRHQYQGHDDASRNGAIHIQLTRSCCKWSSGHPTEHSIANAYVSAIESARHFIYIENQFFITATSNEQRPIMNKIGAAIVDRIIRARDNGETFKVWVVMPSVPAFAGDLKSKDALGTRAIMKYQYMSISRGGHSIMEKLQQAGIEDPSQYIGFFNLRNYDRINTSQTMREAEQRAGVGYEEARRAHDSYVNADDYARDNYGSGRHGHNGSVNHYDDRGHHGHSGHHSERSHHESSSRHGGTHHHDSQDSYESRDGYSRHERTESYHYESRYESRRGHGDRVDRARYDDGDRYDSRDRYDDRYDGRHDGRYDDRNEDRRPYDNYQKAAAHVKDTTRDTVSASYMEGGRRIVDVPWDGRPEDEMNSFVSEQLYIHSKLLIADDCLAICGSANLNDRSQLGTHDSEIAVVIEGGPAVDSYMNGRPCKVSQFVSSLRRQIFRKHLGLLPDQPWDQPNQNWTPVNHSLNSYDWDSECDRIVEDPLSPRFMNLWEDTASINTEVFSRAFHPVPDNNVRNWKDYDQFFSQHFNIPGAKPDSDSKNGNGKVDYGHIVPEEFPGGVRELKQWLGRVRGTLVHMPLAFLIDVADIAEEGLTLNGLTNELYT
ncbi:Phospholipase D1 [Escovopsis weberi]|uniref:Phospholipase n=1 Tax=Escovopsis weberi TaxID=150374 RepID=A0A0N0RT65_ESCWE|nr:Phospholipase D1 [Escovopsis weberi]